jgi:hypothetical protein
LPWYGVIGIVLTCSSRRKAWLKLVNIDVNAFFVPYCMYCIVGRLPWIVTH